MSKTLRTTATLRDTLFNEMDKLIAGQIDDARAHAVARLANAIVSTSRLELDHNNAANGKPDAVVL